MKKVKKFLSSPIVTIAAFVLAAGLLLFGSVGGAQAALTYFSETYTSDIELSEIGVALVENGAVKSGADALLSDMLAEGEALKLGKHYTEELKVRNTGSISQYVRVNVYRYWKEPTVDGKEGSKARELAPELIQLMLGGQELGAEAGRQALLANGWLVDDAASTRERMVLYYSRPVAAADDASGAVAGESALFADSLAIDGAVLKEAVKTPVGNGTFRISYVYDGYEFCLDVKVDAVQDHNAADAILSAWGRAVTIDGNGILSLN